MVGFQSAHLSMDRMTSQESVELLLEVGVVKSKYELAACLGVQPIQIDGFIKGARMSAPVALSMFVMFDIRVTDVFDKQGKRAM